MIVGDSILNINLSDMHLHYRATQALSRDFQHSSGLILAIFLKLHFVVKPEKPPSV